MSLVTGADSEKFSISSFDPLQWMGAVRMSVQTAAKNITIIHMTPVNQLTSCEAKSCMFLRNQSIKTFLTSDRYLQLKESSIHIITFSSEKLRCEICTD